MGVWQSPLPALQGVGRRQIDAVTDERIAHVTGERLWATERVLGLWRGAPQVDASCGTLEGIAVDLGPSINTEGWEIVLPEIFGLIITNNEHHVGVPRMQALSQDRERLHDPLLVGNVLTESVVLPELFQELGWWLII